MERNGAPIPYHVRDDAGNAHAAHDDRYDMVLAYTKVIPGSHKWDGRLGDEYEAPRWFARAAACCTSSERHGAPAERTGRIRLIMPQRY